MSEILVVGSLAYDTISTPVGRVDRALGGSANYFSLAASRFAPVKVVGVVGDDYEQKHVEMLEKRGVDIRGMERMTGRTFHWEGEYDKDMNNAITLATHLNVFEKFDPKLPEDYRDAEFVFLANIDPELQLRVLEQVRSPKFVAMDTMNFWIESKIYDLQKVLKRVDALLINEGEARLLTRQPNAIAAAQEIAKMGPKSVVIKRGEYGFALYSHGEFFILPAYPVGRVVDPTGAGDTFAGGFFGYLAKGGVVDSINELKRACVQGCLLASFTVQDFGVEGIAGVTESSFHQRHIDYSRIISYPLPF